MSKFNKTKRKTLLNKPVEPFKIKGSSNTSDVLSRMTDTAFQGKNFGRAADCWEQMITTPKTTIFMGLAGAMVPAGMREIIVHLIKNRYIDCLVSTGANLFHDTHETLGYFHWQGSHLVDDNELRDAGLDRMYDVFASDEEFNKSDEYIFKFAETLDRRPYTTREFLSLMGKDLAKAGKILAKKSGQKYQDGIVTAAYKYDVPIYCPAIGDSAIGIALACRDGRDHIMFDVVGDVKETAEIAAKASSSGVVIIGGGTPKNFIHQTEVTADMMGKEAPGHRFALQITTDAPHWGGLSGCTFEEAQSWGKIAKKSERVTVACDSTIALPIITTVLAQRLKKYKRVMPDAVDFEKAYKVKKAKWDK